MNSNSNLNLVLHSKSNKVNREIKEEKIGIKQEKNGDNGKKRFPCYKYDVTSVSSFVVKTPQKIYYLDAEDEHMICEMSEWTETVQTRILIMVLTLLFYVYYGFEFEENGLEHLLKENREKNVLHGVLTRNKKKVLAAQGVQFLTDENIIQNFKYNKLVEYVSNLSNEGIIKSGKALLELMIRYQLGGHLKDFFSLLKRKCYSYGFELPITVKQENGLIVTIAEGLNESHLFDKR